MIQMQNKNLGDPRFERIESLYNAIENGNKLSSDDVRQYAADITTRQITYDLLKERGPYFDDSKPYDWPSATFSRIDSKFGQVQKKKPVGSTTYLYERIKLSVRLF